MKQLKRLDVTPQDTFRKAQRGTLRSMAIPEDDFRALERERPELVVVDGDAVLIGWPCRIAGSSLSTRRLDLHYAFPDRDTFARQFADMFGKLLLGADAQEAPLGIAFRLVDRSQRPYVEPLLFAHAFELNREWMEMTLLELPEDARQDDDIAPGFRLRPATLKDAEATIRLEEVCFPNSASLTVAQAREALRTAVMRLLEDAQTGDLAGSLMLEQRSARLGYIATIAVHPDYQRRGLGEALMRWAFAWFRWQKLRSAALTVSTWNAPAIALYRKLGFAVTEMGFDYRRPIDAEEARQVLEKRQTVRVQMRRRFR
ncbi:MAG: GNAT family N-acetyltransferase [Dehalococcoidia bacterium]